MSNVARQQKIFDAALEIEDEVQREVMVDRACAGDPQLREQLRELLEARLKADAFFSDCVTAVASSAAELHESGGLEEVRVSDSEDAVEDNIGSRVGPYKLLQKIGEGGCGVVYMAEQESPVRRRVALKIIKLGMDTRNVIARFEAERQALALMNHPNIARVLDAGATESGRPFFVMELVHGVRITDYCDANNQATTQRLELLIQVCQAIQHAHQKGVIHRDIKPSNILVTVLDGVPIPKVIDFGIAKAIEEKLTDKTLFTLYGHFIGTPAYMSPEQAQMSAADVDTRSDIYSLGVLLYELLTGKTPFDQEELLASGIDEMRRTLSDKEPHRPSTKLDTLRDTELTVTAQRRHVEPFKLRSDLRGDLDWIVMRALEKDRNRRYETANGLGLDVRRYLNHEPVSARPPSRLYWFQKLVRRNKVGFAAGTAVALALVLGFGASTWLFFREREARGIADHALASEAELRRETEAHLKITQAAILMSRGDYASADALVEEIDLPILQPSLEAASVLRRLAEWNAEQRNWRTVADRLLKLIQANQIDQSDMTDAATRDLLRVGPALVLIGDANSYQQFCHSVISRFSGTRNPVAAEQVIKASTILPLDPFAIQSLEPLARVVEECLTDSSVDAQPESYMSAWRAFALARFEYRRGNDSKAIGWGRRCLDCSDNRTTCVIMTHAVLAMAFQKLGQVPEAQAELARAQRMLATLFPRGLDGGLPPSSEESGYWHDWIECHLLVNEANAEIHGVSASLEVTPADVD